jgi:hypothetical protein
MSKLNKNNFGSSVDIPLKVGNDDSGMFSILIFLEISKIGNPKVSVSVATFSFPFSSTILLGILPPLIDGLENGFCVSSKCSVSSANSRSIYPITDSSVLGPSSGASLDSLELPPGGICSEPMSVELVWGFVF